MFFAILRIHEHGCGCNNSFLESVNKWDCLKQTLQEKKKVFYHHKEKDMAKMRN